MSRALEDLNAALEVLEREGLGWRWHWREEPFGPCNRCYWDTNTLGPDGRPWHAFCWENPSPPTSWDQWLLRKTREQEREP